MTEGANTGLWHMVIGAGPMVKLVLLILFAMSVFTWAIILYKVKTLRKMERQTASFYELFWKTGDLDHIGTLAKNYPLTPLSAIFKNVYSELTQMESTARKTPERKTSEALRAEYLKRVLKKNITIERGLMENFTSFLATTGNTAPFIGLFGTVWGIMNSFRSIGIKGAANLAVVAPGISEALIATAMGLFAAIPAVIGYNNILSRIERISGEMENFSNDIINILEKKGRLGQEGSDKGGPLG